VADRRTETYRRTQVYTCTDGDMAHSVTNASLWTDGLTSEYVGLVRTSYGHPPSYDYCTVQHKLNL